MSKYGYIYSGDKDIAGRVSELRGLGVSEDCIFADAGLKDVSKRPAYKRLKKKLESGDFLYIHDFCDLGETYGEMLQEWNLFTKEIGVKTVLLLMPLLNERLGEEDITDTGEDIASEFLEFGARLEQDIKQKRKERQKQGIEAAKARGVKFGKQAAPVSDNFYLICSKFFRREITCNEGAEALGMSRSTFYYKAMKYREEIVGTSRNRKEGTNNDGK
ncbi:MAG: recombinase family protein [Lachnospiraceae bacterium]|nr:recombinase family protein [Lachnospiraceae bacterium]